MTDLSEGHSQLITDISHTKKLPQFKEDLGSDRKISSESLTENSTRRLLKHQPGRITLSSFNISITYLYSRAVRLSEDLLRAMKSVRLMAALCMRSSILCSANMYLPSWGYHSQCKGGMHEIQNHFQAWKLYPWYKMGQLSTNSNDRDRKSVV